MAQGLEIVPNRLGVSEHVRHGPAGSDYPDEQSYVDDTLDQLLRMVVIDAYSLESLDGGYKISIKPSNKVNSLVFCLSRTVPLWPRLRFASPINLAFVAHCSTQRAHQPFCDISVRTVV